MRKWYLLVMIFFILSGIAEALQVKPIQDNKTVLVKIASKEQSRIFVKGDRILVVRGLDGAYDLKKDDDLGDIYIQPSPYYQHKIFNLFITTEQGRTFSLLASPLDIPAETIELKPLSPSLTLAKRWETNSPYAETMVNLISAMVNHANPDGYAVIHFGKIKPKKLNNCLTMQLLTMYRGDHLQGEIWKVKNKSQKSVYVTPRIFYQDNVRALSLSDEKLLPEDETFLYRVVSS
jgi:conjugal transfer pilus assembly protein TraK